MHNLYDFLRLNEEHRNHPVVGALLYTYCPAAAGWWGAGVGLPTKRPYDVVTHVLEIYTQEGMTLKKALGSFGVSSLFESVKKYLKDIEIYRKNMPIVSAPELLPSFSGAGVEMVLRLGNDAMFDKHFGGDWRNVLEFARVWAYVLQSWQNVIVPMTEGSYQFERKQLAFRTSNTGFSVVVPAWVWIKGNGRRPCIGIVSEGGVHDQIQIFMNQFSAPERDKTWEIIPHVFVLNPRTGEARTAEYAVEKKLMAEILSNLGGLAKSGPHPPLGALDGLGKCSRCLFHDYCFEKSGILSDFVMRLLDPGSVQVTLRQEALLG